MVFKTRRFFFNASDPLQKALNVSEDNKKPVQQTLNLDINNVGYEPNIKEIDDLPF